MSTTLHYVRECIRSILLEITNGFFSNPVNWLHDLLIIDSKQTEIYSSKRMKWDKTIEK